MAFLLIDAGNTRVKWATCGAAGSVRVKGSVLTKKVTSRWAEGLAKRHARERVVIACVVPGVAVMLRKVFGQRALLVTSESAGLAFDYPKPKELGADRLAAAVAVTGPAIIVSCGTATAFSVLDWQGRFCGGVIAPGLETQLAALLGATAQLPRTALRPVAKALSRSTGEAIRAGVVLNFQGGVREIVGQLRCDLKTECRVILTGGHASFLKGVALGATELRPLLVFEGLHIIGRRFFADS